MKKFILLFIVFTFFLSTSILSQEENLEIKRLIQSLNKLNQSSIKVDSLNEIAFLYLFENNLELAQQYALQAEALAKKINYIKGEASSQVRLGQVKMYQIENEKSEYYFKNALKLRIQLGNKSDIASVHNNLGILHLDAGNANQAIDHYKSGLEVLDEINDAASFTTLLSLKARMHNNLGTSYKRTGKYKEAEYHFEKSIQLRKQLGSEVNIAKSYMNLGSLYYEPEFLDTIKSKKYLIKSLDLFTKKQNNRGQAQCLINLGNLSFHQEKHQEVLAYYAKAKEKKEYLNDIDLIRIARNEGSIFFNDKQYEKAIEVYKNCLDSYQDSNNQMEMAYLYCDLGNVYLRQSDFVQADSFLNKSLVLADELQLFGLKIASLSSIKDVQESVLFKEQLRRERIVLTGILALASVLLIASFLLYRNRKKRQLAEKNALLSKQEIDVLVGQQVLKTTSARLEGVEQERKRIASELHDQVGVMLSTAKLYFAPMDKQIDSLDQEDRDKYEKATQILDETYDAVRRISHDMASPTLSNQGLLKELQLLVNKIEETKHFKINLIAHDMQERLDNNIEIRLYRIIQELLTNALKHAKATEINIELNHFGELINVMIEDNGVGFDTTSLAQRKDIGMGLDNIKTGIEHLKGTFTIDSKIGRGTSISMDIPLQN